MTKAFQDLLDTALAAGRKAGLECYPQPMIVGSAKSPTSSEIDYTKPVFCVDDGACGFAWVKIRPGNCAFANWLKKNGLARAAYGGGVDIWISEFNQSVDRKYAMAQAMAKVISDAGIVAYADSRLD